MTYHRFIGGVADGEWHLVRRDAGLFLPPTWTIQARCKDSSANFDPNAPIEPTLIRQSTYVPLPMHVGKEEAVTFFIEQSMKPTDALLRLAECYRPPDSAGDGT